MFFKSGQKETDTMKTGLVTLAAFSLIVMMVIPAHATVSSVNLDRDFFTIDDTFTVLGTVSDSERVTLLASMKGPGSEKITRTAMSNNDGTYSFVSVQADELFRSEGTYQINVFTEFDRPEEGTVIKIEFKNGVITSMPDYELFRKRIGNMQVTATDICSFTASGTDSQTVGIE